MRGEKYLSDDRKKELACCRGIIVGAYIKYFSGWGSASGVDESRTRLVLSRAMEDGREEVSETCLKILADFSSEASYEASRRGRVPIAA